MKCKIPEISWHNRDPVLSVDIQPKSNANNTYRLASGGTDAHVLIWYMKLTSTGEYGDIELDLAADLTRHQRAVNAVKWSPNGELLASGDDESVVFIWKLKSDSEPLNILDSTNEQDKEVWITLKVLRGHMEDIYDLSWAPNSLYLVSGSVDNSAMVWDVQKGKSISILNDHKGFVQGVAWDPKNQYIATLSTDRYLRIFDIQSKKVLYRVSKGILPISEDNPLHGKRMRLFHDDTLQTFFRRLSFTPDGKLLLTPAGVTDYDGCTSPINTTYAFSRYGFRQPAIVLPCPDQYTVAVRCCPILYKLRPFNAEKNAPVVPLPYRMIFAVATKSSVYFYDTQQKQPFALISNIHYTRLTDITWSNDGRIVVVSSTDGFCSLITFEQGELGEEYENSEAALEAALAQVTKKTKKQKDSDGPPKSRKPSTDDSGLNKENDSKHKEVQLEKIVEQENPKKEDDINYTHMSIKHKPDNEKKPQEEKLKDNDTKQTPTPIAIKRKPGLTDNQEKYIKENDSKQKETQLEKIIEQENPKKDDINLTPIAIIHKPDNEKSQEDKLKDNNTKQTPTPIAIKRKPGLTDNQEKDIKENDSKQKEAQLEKIIEQENPKKEDDINLTPIAIKHKPDNEEKEPQEDKLKDNYTKQTPTPIAIKRKPGLTDNQEKDNKPNPISIKRKPGPVEETNKNKDEQKPTPIAIKRKPGPVESTDTKNEVTIKDKESLKISEDTTPPKKAAITPTKVLADELIADKESLKPSEETTPPKIATIIPTKVLAAEISIDKESIKPSDETTPPKIATIIPAKVLAAEIIIDKEILSSEEKFESPEKKSRPVTPILTRRHPRTPNSTTQTPTTTCQTPTSMSGVLKTQFDLQNQSPLSSITKEVKTPRQDKKATPIAVRRAPRSIITTPSVVDAPSLVEEAMDAWPSSKDSNTKENPTDSTSKDNLKESGIAPLPISDATCERTEDIRLVYEETNEEAPIKESLPKPLEVEEKVTTLPEKKTDDTPKQQTPSGPKTPRRVALKTISTPKSKKKLLDSEV